MESGSCIDLLPGLGSVVFIENDCLLSELFHHRIMETPDLNNKSCFLKLKLKREQTWPRLSHSASKEETKFDLRIDT